MGSITKGGKGRGVDLEVLKVFDVAVDAEDTRCWIQESRFRWSSSE
jgi:hypothetical protein